MLRLHWPPDGRRCRSAVIVMPGGGYGRLASGHEGEEVAGWLSHLGITAFVLHYRCAPTYRYPIPLLDAQRAVRYVRSHAAAWDVRSYRVGIIGFSAGGHLAATVGMHSDPGAENAEDPIERASSRPDFMILGYPVISMDPAITHLETRENLLGPGADQELVHTLSNETQVREGAPPTFLFHSTADEVVSVQNSICFHQACLSANVSTELHVYQQGGHGVGLARDDAAMHTWPMLCARWLASQGCIENDRF